MDQPYISPRFICKSILKAEGGWMVTFPDYEAAGENPFSVRENTRVLESQELLEWIERRIIRLGGIIAKPLEDKDTEFLDLVVPIPVTKYTPTGAKARTTAKMKKLKCGHLHPRRKGVYPRRCSDCQKLYNDKLALIRKKLK